MDYGSIKQRYSARQLSVQNHWTSFLLSRYLGQQLQALKKAGRSNQAAKERTFIRSMGSQRVVGL